MIPGTEVSLLSTPSSKKLLLRSRDRFTVMPALQLLDAVGPGAAAGRGSHSIGSEISDRNLRSLYHRSGRVGHRALNRTRLRGRNGRSHYEHDTSKNDLQLLHFSSPY